MIAERYRYEGDNHFCGRWETKLQVMCTKGQLSGRWLAKLGSILASYTCSAAGWSSQPFFHTWWLLNCQWESYLVSTRAQKGSVQRTSATSVCCYDDLLCLLQTRCALKAGFSTRGKRNDRHWHYSPPYKLSTCERKTMIMHSTWWCVGRSISHCRNVRGNGMGR